MRAVSLGLALFLFWLLLSGHYTPFLIAMGGLSTLAILGLAWRMTVVDEEAHPVHLAPSALTYWPWLAWEIVKSSWGVTKIILDPSLPISPTLVRVRGSQKSSLGLATYANSITLTPGTITVEVQRNDLLVHALTADGAADLEGGGMDARVARMEGTA